MRVESKSRLTGCLNTALELVGCLHVWGRIAASVKLCSSAVCCASVLIDGQAYTQAGRLLVSNRSVPVVLYSSSLFPLSAVHKPSRPEVPNNVYILLYTHTVSRPIGEPYYITSNTVGWGNGCLLMHVELYYVSVSTMIDRAFHMSTNAAYTRQVCCKYA